MDFAKILSGGDLRSVGNSNKVVAQVSDQHSFDKLFGCLFHTDRTVVMRAADAIEKITAIEGSYLHPHKRELIALLHNAQHIELKWHLAQLVSRLQLSPTELSKVWRLLTNWAQNQHESKIVRVNSLQSLRDLCQRWPTRTQSLKELISKLKKENVPSLTARINKLKMH